MAIRKPIELSEQERFEIKFSSGIVNLLAYILVTIANIAVFVFNQSVLLPFSAAIPYYAVAYGYLPGYLSVTSGWMLAMMFFLLCIVCWVRAKEDWRWLMGGFTLVTLDTIVLVWLVSQQMAISVWPDIFFHAWMMYYLSNGVRYGRKLERIPGTAPIEKIEDGE